MTGSSGTTALVERGATYRLVPAYSRREDGGEQPWVTREEATRDARAEGARAVFID